MQLRPQVLYLCFGQLGSIATHSMVFQSRHTALAVLPTPTHQTALAAPGDLSHLLCRGVGAIQSDGQKATPRWTILALRVCMAQFLNLLLRQLKLTFGHMRIIQHLISLSIRTGVP
jgi:hypothetical protein